MLSFSSRGLAFDGGISATPDSPSFVYLLGHDWDGFAI